MSISNENSHFTKTVIIFSEKHNLVISKIISDIQTVDGQTLGFLSIIAIVSMCFHYSSKPVFIPHPKKKMVGM